MNTPKITLIGGPTALIEIAGFRFLTDPTFDEPGEYKLPVPVHYEGWAHFKQSGDDLVKAFNTLGFGSRLRLLEPGVATIIVSGTKHPKS